MRNTQPLLEALLADEAAGPLSSAIHEARRVRTARARRNLGAVAILLVVGALFIFGRPAPESGASHPAVASNGIHVFSTADAAFSVPSFSSASAPRLAIFSNGSVHPLAFRDIDDTALFQLLNPYGPVIVYLGEEKQPSLLLMNPSH